MSTLDAPVDALKELLTTPSKLNYADESLHRQVYERITSVMESAPRTRSPPLRVLTYAARNILLPTFLVEQTLDLLMLLVHIDIIRTHAVEKCKLALRWNKQFELRPQPNLRTLMDEDRALLEGFVQEDSEVEDIFHRVTNECYSIDVYYAYLARDPSVEPLQRLALYFPAQFSMLYELDTQEVEIQKLLHGPPLSDEEREAARLMAIQCGKFIQDASSYHRDPKAHCASARLAYAPFDQLFPQPNTKIVVTLAKLYLQKVEDVASALERLFGDGSC